jgi:hypothetical protein
LTVLIALVVSLLARIVKFLFTPSTVLLVFELLLFKLSV